MTRRSISASTTEGERPALRLVTGPTDGGPGGSADRIRVLLVDDHPVIRNIIRLACERSERIAVVGEAADGEGALVQARRLQPDVVVLDLSLPGVSGFEAARRLKRANQGTRIVAISDRRDLRTIVECRAIGVEGYFEKTDGLENVVRAIEAVTDGDRAFTSISRGRQVRGSGAPWVRLREGGK